MSIWASASVANETVKPGTALASTPVGSPAGGSGEHDLTPTPDPVDEYWPAWSPDGTRIAYGVGSDEHFTSDVVVMHADGSHAKTLPRQGVQLQTLPIPWSPDGTRILSP